MDSRELYRKYSPFVGHVVDLGTLTSGGRLVNRTGRISGAGTNGDTAYLTLSIAPRLLITIDVHDVKYIEPLSPEETY